MDQLPVFGMETILLSPTEAVLTLCLVEDDMKQRITQVDVH